MKKIFLYICALFKSVLLADSADTQLSISAQSFSGDKTGEIVVLRPPYASSLYNFSHTDAKIIIVCLPENPPSSIKFELIPFKQKIIFITKENTPSDELILQPAAFVQGQKDDSNDIEIHLNPHLIVVSRMSNEEIDHVKSWYISRLANSKREIDIIINEYKTLLKK